jgi:hypothetical protein
MQPCLQIKTTPIAKYHALMANLLSARFHSTNSPSISRWANLPGSTGVFKQKNEKNKWQPGAKHAAHKDGQSFLLSWRLRSGYTARVMVLGPYSFIESEGK